MEAVAAENKAYRPLLIVSSYNNSEFIFSKDKTLKFPFSGMQWLEEVVIQYGASLQGRMDSFCHLTNAHQKPCILISEQTMNMYFPIRGKDNPENVFVYFNKVMDIQQTKNNHTRIYFGNGYSYEVPCDYRTVKSQMKRCDQFIHTVMQNKKDLVIDFREICH